MCIINIHAYNRPKVHTVFSAHTYIQQKHCICYQAAIWVRVQCNWAIIYQWVKPPRVQGDSLCQRLRQKHHYIKLLPVTTTASTKCKGQCAKCKGQDQHQHKLERDAATTCNSNHHHHRPAQDQHWRWWSARCSNHCNLHKGTQF